MAKLSLDLSLINVMYGVVFAYGFNFFDHAKTPNDYLRFFFAYAILIIDWIYSHHSYQDKNFNKNSLLLDVAILFLFSRLLNSSTVGDPVYFFWLAIIFMLYLVWDRMSQKKKLFSGYDWSFCIYGDAIGAFAFLVLWVISEQKIINYNSFNTLILGFVVYLVSFSFWLKKAEKKHIS